MNAMSLAIAAIVFTATAYCGVQYANNAPHDYLKIQNISDISDTPRPGTCSGDCFVSAGNGTVLIEVRHKGHKK